MISKLKELVDILPSIFDLDERTTTTVVTTKCGGYDSRKIKERINELVSRVAEKIEEETTGIPAEILQSERDSMEYQIKNLKEEFEKARVELKAKEEQIHCLTKKSLEDKPTEAETPKKTTDESPF